MSAITCGQPERGLRGEGATRAATPADAAQPGLVLQANAVKLAGNDLIVCAIEALADSTAFLSKSGVAPAQFVELMTSSLFASPIYQNYGAILTERRFSPPGFKLPLGLKDVRLVLQAAERVAAPLPFASVVRDQMVSAIARGYGELDWSALALVVEENAGVAPPAEQRDQRDRG